MAWVLGHYATEELTLNLQAGSVRSLCKSWQMYPEREQQKVLCAQQKLGRWVRKSLVAALQQAAYQSLIPEGATAHSTKNRVRRQTDKPHTRDPHGNAQDRQGTHYTTKLFPYRHIFLERFKSNTV